MTFPPSPPFSSDFCTLQTSPTRAHSFLGFKSSEMEKKKYFIVIHFITQDQLEIKMISFTLAILNTLVITLTHTARVLLTLVRTTFSISSITYL